MTITPDRPTLPQPTTDWDTRSACRPPVVKGRVLMMTRPQIVAACRVCPVIEDCFRAGYYQGDRVTYRAAMTPEQRDDRYKELGIPLPKAAAPAVRMARPGVNGARLVVDLDAVAKMRAAQQSWRQIGRTLNCNPEELARRWRQSGRALTRAEPTTRDLTTDVDPAVLVALVRAEKNVTQIAVHFGVSRSAVERHIARARQAGLL